MSSNVIPKKAHFIFLKLNSSTVTYEITLFLRIAISIHNYGLPFLNSSL